MRVLTQGVLMRATRTGLSALLRRIADELPEGSREQRAARFRAAQLGCARRSLATF
jgi:hypothetical protein